MNKCPKRDALVKFFVGDKKVDPEELRLAINQLNKAMGFNWKITIDAYDGDWNICKRKVNNG